LLDREIIQRAIKEYENKQSKKNKHKKKKKHGKHRLPTMPPPPSEAVRVIMEPMGAEGTFHLNASKISEHLRTGRLDSAGSLRADKTVSKVSEFEGPDSEVTESQVSELDSQGLKNLFTTPPTVEIQTEEAFKFIPLTDSTPDKTRTPPKEVTFKWVEENEPSKKKLKKEEKPHHGHFNRFNRFIQQLKDKAGGSVRRVAAPTTTMQTIVYSTFRPRATPSTTEVVIEASTEATTEATEIATTQPTTTTVLATVLATVPTTEATTTQSTTSSSTPVTSTITSTTETTTKSISVNQELPPNFDYSKNRPFEPSSGSGEYYYEYYYEYEDGTIVTVPPESDYYYDDGNFEDMTIRPITDNK